MILLCILGLAEAGTRALAYYGRVAYRVYQTGDQPDFWGDIDPHFGVWHYPDATYVHRSPCFTVRYTSNSYGARDRERSPAMMGTERAVVLGDSFVEGWGVSRDERVTDRLEEATGIEHLNFGTAGGFGSIQEWQLYEHLASRFEHSRVLLFLLPDNDFLDNRPPAAGSPRYRPCLRRHDGEFELYYPTEFRPTKRTETFPLIKRLRRGLYNSVYLLNVFRQLGEDRPEAVADFVPYDDFTEEDGEILLYSYRRIAELAAPRPLSVFIIPRHRDIAAYRRGELDFKVVRLLEAFAADQPGVQVVDLLPEIVSYADRGGISTDALFLPCDGHWSKKGHRLVADIVQRAVYGDATP